MCRDELDLADRVRIGAGPEKPFEGAGERFAHGIGRLIYSLPAQRCQRIRCDSSGTWTLSRCGNARAV